MRHTESGAGAGWPTDIAPRMRDSNGTAMRRMAERNLVETARYKNGTRKSKTPARSRRLNIKRVAR
eukprot:644-Eustigmatos_ZCMA.PRE.1